MFFCAKCGRKWQKDDASDNEFTCTKKCGGELAPLEDPQKTMNIFISYGRDIYTKVARKIKHDLSDRGYNVWFDDERLHGGSEWEDYIEKGINLLAADPDNGKLIYLMTPHSTRKPDGYCLNELAYAVMKNVKIIPVMLVQSEPPLSIARIQYLDVQDCVDGQGNVREEIYTKYLKRLVEAIDHNSLDFEGTQSRLINELKPLTFNNDMLYYLEDFVGREWIVDIFDKWVSDFDSSKVFWLVGPPGIGKSAVSAWLREKKPSIKAFHFCSYKDLEKRNPVKLVTSISYQLATQIPEYMAKLAELNIKSILSDYNDAYTLFEKLIAEPFMSDFPEPDEAIVILIDALDEATENLANDIARFIESRFPLTPKWLKLFITSRDNDPCLTTIFQSISKTLVNAEHIGNIDDIKLYLKKMIDKTSLALSLTEEQITKMSKCCEGNFLYAKWMVIEIKEGRYRIDDVVNYPKGLGGVYSSYFARQFPDLQNYKKETRIPLSVVLSAIEPIDIRLLKNIMGWKELDVRDFVESLGSLFSARDHKLVAYHKSLSDWLRSEQSVSYFVSITDGNEELSSYGWGEFKKSPDTLNEYFLKWLPKHLMRSGRHEDVKELLINEMFILCRIKIGLTEFVTEDVRAFYDSGSADSAVIIAEKIYSLFEGSDHNDLLLSIINMTSQLYIEKGDYETALLWSNRGLNAGHKIADFSKMSSLHIVGDTCKAKGLFSEALKYYSDSLSISSGLNDPVSMTKLYISAGHAYYGLFNFDESRKMYEKAGCIINNSSYKFSLNDIGELYEKLAMIEACSGYLSESFSNRLSLLEMHNRNPSLNTYIKVCRGISHVLFHTLQFDYSLKFLEMAQKAHASVKHTFSDLHQKQLRWLSLLSRLNNQIGNAFSYSTELMNTPLTSNDERNIALNLAERGCCLLYVDRIMEGIELLNESLAYDVNTMPERSYRYLAEGYLLLGKYDEAEKSILDSLKISIKSCATETYLGYEIYGKIADRLEKTEEASIIKSKLEESRHFLLNQQIRKISLDNLVVELPINSPY